MIRAKKKAADLGGDQWPQQNIVSQKNNVTLTEDEVKHFEYLINMEMYRRDYYAGNWQSHHYA